MPHREVVIYAQVDAVPVVLQMVAVFKIKMETTEMLIRRKD